MVSAVSSGMLGFLAEFSWPHPGLIIPREGGGLKVQQGMKNINNLNVLLKETTTIVVVSFTVGAGSQSFGARGVFFRDSKYCLFKVFL